MYSMVKRSRRKLKTLDSCDERLYCRDWENINVTSCENEVKYPPVLISRLRYTDKVVIKSLDRKEAILVGGPVGCGKSTFVNRIAKRYCCKVHNIQISEHTDAKTLLGAYCCTEVPGQFIWRPGPLISALLQGYGLILEDIDRGSSELHLLVTYVLRRLNDCSASSKAGVLVDPVTGNPIIQHNNFRLFMTRRFISSHGGDLRHEFGNPLTELLDRYCFVISLPNFSKDEIYVLISQQYPSLVPFIDRIMNIYLFILESFQNDSITVQNPLNASRMRAISVRDLLKFCSRVSLLTEQENFSELLLLNAVDCFLCSMCNCVRKLEIACRLAGELNLSVEKARNMLCCRSIEISLHPQKSILKAGRTILPCRRSSDWEMKVAGGSSMLQSSSDIIWPFASTRLSCSLLERLAVAVQHKEPVLLVGETGTGKTSTVQRLAYLTGHRLKVINLNQQSDSVDLMGGFKPVDFQVFIRPLREKFESLFTCTFKLDSNQTFLGHINTCFISERWLDLISLMRHPAQVAVQRESCDSSEWIKFLNELHRVEKRLENITKSNKTGLGFAFIEGALVRAVQEGDWILLDEINLAPAEMLDSLSGLLDSEYGSLVLTERGDNEPLKRHHDFHLFAAMNPATDVGKRELPVGLRNRFTEFYVPELDPGIDLNVNNKSENPISNDLDNSRHAEILRSNNREDLATLAKAYLIGLNPTPSQLSTIVRLYSALRQAAIEGLVDGVGQRPHFSLRTLCRALLEAGRGYHGSVLRSLYEGLLFSFGSQICRTSRPILDTLIQRYLSSGWNTECSLLVRLLNTPLPVPPLSSLPVDNIDNLKVSRCSEDYFVNVEGYWLPKGSQQPISVFNRDAIPGNYILTPSVQANLKDLARVVSAGGGLPVLLQGETSVGKTSLITYLAKRVGQVCYRINNHEHTDQQTYLGTYTVASTTQTAKTENNEGKSPNTAPLVFKDGLLVKAMRHGYWIILDELNLAPTEILEALNRVLDDNRSVFITETQETVKAHPHFRLFATQNPPGLYAGRKMLSRALRNRFIELHFDTIPRNELEIILEKKCLLPPSRAHRLVEVMHRLQLARCSSNLFQGKDSFITLRDLFRWAERYRLATCDKVSNQSDDTDKDMTKESMQFFDWDAYLADQGYLLLAGRVRNEAEVQVVADVIETVFKRKVTESRLFDLNENTSPAVREFLQPILGKNVVVSQSGFEHIVWTRDMRRLLVLIGNALKYEEPVLLVGETGCGKTTVCQMIAAMHNQRLHCVNCHQCTEASDFLGGLRPIRHSSVDEKKSTDDCHLFEWVNGPLVVAMLNGDVFLLDEISLADDAVLERLNSLLEPERQLHLAECTEDLLDGSSLDSTQLTAHSKFRFIATMNPGGDYGKKELSPALRNRFTEIWCPSPIFTPIRASTTTTPDNPNHLSNSLSDCIEIVLHNLKLKIPAYFGNENKLARPFSEKMVDFVHWFAVTQAECKSNGFVSLCHRSPPTIRDLIAWIEFIRVVTSNGHLSNSIGKTMDLFTACIHGACLVFLDALDETTVEKSDEQRNNDNDGDFHSMTIHYLIEQLTSIDNALIQSITPSSTTNSDVIYAEFCTKSNEQFMLIKSNELFGCEPFFISTGPYLLDNNETADTSFIFDAPTPASNLKRLLRAMQLPGRALLLEGSPGVGKTTLVLALAKASGHKVIRINLSEATEASDLFGCDLPVEGAEAGVFAWKSGPFLQGLCEGHWIILDEMNLASQSVLECLNACLDHRGEVFIPELNTTFKINSQTTRLFACQNPLREGGGRKGLPRSFLNRFTQVYMKSLTISDQEFILVQLYPGIPKSCIHLIVAFNQEVNKRINIEREFGSQGGPWEFNLRDLTRWCDLLMKGKSFEGLNPGLYVHLLYTDRMRTVQDKQKIVTIWNECCSKLDMPEMFYYEPHGDIRLIFNESIQCGFAHLKHLKSAKDYSTYDEYNHLLLLDRQRGVMESFLKVIEMGWMVMLIGPPGCGKRTLAHIASIILGQNILSMCLSPTSDTIELLGSLEQREAGGLFEWVDSPLVKGIVNGNWVLIENAQLCSPSTLDRLNSLLEPNGELLLSERGLDANGKLVTLKAHPNFRLILTIDEVGGGIGGCAGSTGISRAMRNRGLEITFIEPISQPHLDLLRLFTSINVPKLIATGLIEFSVLFLEACENTNHFFEHHPTFLTEIQASVSSSSSSTTFQSIACHNLKKPPIGALISAGQYAKQLLTNQSQLDSDVSNGSETEKIKMTRNKKRKLNDQKKKKTEKKQPLVDLDDKYDISVEVDFGRILKHVLHVAYCQRQMNAKSVDFVQHLITYYVENMFTCKASNNLGLMIHLPTNYFHHSVKELIENRLPNSYRQFHASLVNLTLSEYSRPINPALLLLAKRILLEQANLTDVCGNKDDQLMNLLTQSTMEQPIVQPDWMDWPDLRWIPGWKHLIGELDRESNQLMYTWNKYLYSLLLNDLFHSTNQFINTSSFDSQSSACIKSSADLCNIPLLQVIKLSSGNNLPVMWLDNYPGLVDLCKQWINYLNLLWTQFPSFCDAQPTDLSQLYEVVSKAWSWIHLFGSRPLGDSFDWPERCAFHNKRVMLTEDDQFESRLPQLSMILQYLHKSTPSTIDDESQSEVSVLSFNWIQFGQFLNEFLLRFNSELTLEKDVSDESNAEDDMMNEENTDVGSNDFTTSGTNNFSDDATGNDFLNFYCLWPWTMILVSKFIESYLFINVQCHEDFYRSMKKSLRIYFRCVLMTLNRPNLLAYLVMAQSMLKGSSYKQIHVVKQLTQEFTITSSESSFSSLLLSSLFQRLDWSLPNQILNFRSVNQPDVLGEWRSISHALIHLTWPMLSDYGAYAYCGRLTVYGWRNRQRAVQKANHLLFLSPSKCEELNDIPKEEFSQSRDMNSLVQHAFNILHGIYKSISSVYKSTNNEHNDAMYSVAVCDNLVDLVTWIHSCLKPLISIIKSDLTNRTSSNWYRIACLVELLTNQLNEMLVPSSVQPNIEKAIVHTNFSLSICWLLIGCLYLRCVCPHSPLDPYLVIQVEEEAVHYEMNSINSELEFRESIQRHAVGLYNCLQSLKNLPPLSVTEHVNSGLLHPWLGVLVNRQQYLREKAANLKHQLGSSCKDILTIRQNSNFEYVEIRRRITTFLSDFTEDFLLPHLPEMNNNYVEMIEKNLKLHTVNRWIEATSNLADWLTDAHRFNTFADIITPFLYGLFYVYRGLRIAFHEITARSNPLNVSISSMMQMLITSLLPSTKNNTNILFPLNQRSSQSMSLALELASPKSRRVIQQLVDSANNFTSSNMNNIQTLHKTQEIQFRISSFLLDLLWLHNAETNLSNVSDNLNKLTGRLLNSMLRPLAQQWKQIEAERKRISEARAALFLEADRRKQLIRNELQGINSSKSKTYQQNQRCHSPELVDQSLNDELDWRLRFSETGSLKAFTELRGGLNNSAGLTKEEEIQQTVNKLAAVDNWLKKSLNSSEKYWIPDENELTYFINRLVDLLLLFFFDRKTQKGTLENQIITVDPNSDTGGQLDVSNVFSWHWHTVLFGYNLASWLSIQSRMSLDPAMDNQYILPYIGITSYMGQYDIRAHPVLPTVVNTSSTKSYTFSSNRHFNSKWLIMKSHCYNVYHDPIPLGEADKLNVIMRNLEKQVKHILTQWPGQPSLLRLLTIIHRIESFTVSDPLIKFVTGIEMLWQEMQEWERDAAKYVSLMESSKEVCNLLVNWRKMELSYWLATLDSAEIQMGNRCLTLWFHLYDLFLRPGSYRQQMKSTDSEGKHQVNKKSCPKDNGDSHPDDYTQLETDRLDALIELFEKGPIGEFTSRWKLVASIYCALNVWPGLGEQERLSSKRVVGNAVWFYAQFLPYVTDELNNLRKPIEKEMKGIVNITKWGHYSRFWSVKTSVDRCKKLIHKHVKNWESILQQPVRPIFESVIKIPNYLEPNADNNDNNHICSSAWLKLNMSEISSVLNQCSIRKSYHYLQQLYCRPNEGMNDLPSHLIRLPSLTKKLHKHLFTIVHHSPILQWIKHIRSGIHMWMTLVQDLSKQTEHLNSSCPSANQLTKFNKQKAYSKSKSHKHSSGDGGDDDEEEEELKKTRKWHQEFTALQQRKRLALSDWLKIATKKSSSSDQSHDIFDYEFSAPFDSDEVMNNNNECSEAKIHTDDQFFETLQLPNLGLSYRRGQRQTQTGHMSRFLVQLHGDPWSYVCQYIGHFNVDDNPDSDEFFIHSVCNRLSRLIALRASLPRVPGPSDGDADTSASILAELGGPNNLSRLVGIMDDLLNQCSVEFKVCSEFTSICRKMNQLVGEYAISLNVYNSKDEVDEINKQLVWCTNYSSDPDRIKRIRVSTQNLDQIIREHIYQWSVFWTVFQKQTTDEPFELSQLSNLFGTEAWTWLTANPKTLLSLSTENPNQLRTITESHLNPLKLAMHQVLKRTSQLLTLNTFLWNDAIHLYCKELCSSLERLQAVLAALIDSYKQMHCSGLFASVFHHLQQQITVESDRIHSELQVLCFTTSVEDDVHMLDTTTITANNDMGSMVVMIGRSEKQFEQLANRTIHSMLKAVEIIHISDQTVSNLDQISLLNHFSKMLSELMICTLPQVNRCLTSLRSMLQQSSSVVENANVNSKSIFHSRLMIVRCIYPLMDGLSKALCTRCIQFWSLLDAWFKLGEFAMQITGRLITEGFCRPANLPRDKNSQAADGTDATSGTSDNGVDDQLDTGDASSGGTSLTSNTGDTTGAKDVSNELECQEQIEGLLNDSKQENNDPGKKERDDTDGIEMPDDDFKGHYDDPEMENCNADDDITDQLDQENFDDKMGETDGSNEDLANEMWASDNDDDNEVKDDADSGNDKAKSNGVENDKSGTEKGGEQNTDNVQKQEKQNPEPKEEKDAADPCDKTDSSSQRKNPKRPQNTSGNRTTVANEDCMENESDQPEGSEATSPTKQNDDHDEHGLPTDCDSEYVDNAEEVPERDVDDLPADLFDNQMDIDNDKGGEEVEPFGQLEEEENNQSTLDDKDLNWNNEIETMDIDKQNVEDLTNVEAFPYHGSGSGDLNTQSNAFGGDDQDVENVDETQTDNMGQNADVNSTTQTPSQTTGNQSSQENASGEKYAQSNGGSQLDTSRLEPLGGQKQQQQSKRNQSLSGPKPTSENRSLANQQKPLSGVDTLEVDSGHHQQQQHDEQNSSSYDEQNTQLFQHLPNSSDPNNTGDEEDNDAPCVRDSATMDQVEKQLNSEGMKESGDTGLENDDSINNHDEDDHERLPTSELEPTDSATNILPEQNRQLHPYVKGKYPGGDEAVESDPTAEIVPTLGAQRPSQSIICTRLEVLLPSAVDTCMSEVLTDIQILDNRFAETSLEGSLEWAACCQRSGGVARQLCEALRLVLEPTKASRLRGDYRTGKRINMRKIIPYLASQFRKDKIWLRRSQPSQREYRILIAVDDSSSMSENLCKQMTFESLATVVTALNLLEVGRIGVCSFGEAVRVLHNPKDPWATDVGPRVLSQFTFEQPKTSLVQLLHCTIHLMNSIGYTNSSNAIPSQLLLILSDGVFSEDPQSPSLQAAVRLARDSHIFPVCLILDDVHKKHSIFDLRRYCGPGKLQPYMDVFPLPYYLVLRDLSCLPNLLADALRQWFELESSFGR